MAIVLDTIRFQIVNKEAEIGAKKPELRDCDLKTELIIMIQKEDNNFHLRELGHI